MQTGGSTGEFLSFTRLSTDGIGFLKNFLLEIVIDRESMWAVDILIQKMIWAVDEFKINPTPYSTQKPHACSNNCSLSFFASSPPTTFFSSSFAAASTVRERREPPWLLWPPLLHRSVAPSLHLWPRLSRRPSLLWSLLYALACRSG